MTVVPRRPSTFDLAALTEAAVAAGQAALRFHRPGGQTTAGIHYKHNNSPVTDADLAADAAAREVLAQRFAGVPLLSEEDPAHATRLDRGMVLVIDPIDGTRAFMTGRSEWCVSLALMSEGTAVAGVIHAPARKETFVAGRGLGAALNGAALPRRPATPPAPLRITGPNRLLDELTEFWPATRDGETLKALAYRLASVAAGMHDVAVATPGANHWDIAAADILLSETGCRLTSLTGAKPVYIGTDPLHPALLAAEDALGAQLLAALGRRP